NVVRRRAGKRERRDAVCAGAGDGATSCNVRGRQPDFLADAKVSGRIDRTNASAIRLDTSRIDGSRQRAIERAEREVDRGRTNENVVERYAGRRSVARFDEVQINGGIILEEPVTRRNVHAVGGRGSELRSGGDRRRNGDAA